MKISTKRVGTVDVLKPHGPLADDDAGVFFEAVKGRLAGANPRFVVDMEEVPYLDSRGIEGLVDAARDMQLRGGRLRLAAVPQTCREVLDLTGHADELEFFQDSQDAVRSFR
jgi:anti-anti-sigma factor